jgi:hypothetical protein
MFFEIEDRWQRRLSPVEDRWERMKQMHADAIHREIDHELPLHLAPVIAAYCAQEHDAIQTNLGAMTAPVTTKHAKTIIQKED